MVGANAKKSTFASVLSILVKIPVLINYATLFKPAWTALEASTTTLSENALGVYKMEYTKFWFKCCFQSATNYSEWMKTKLKLQWSETKIIFEIPVAMINTKSLESGRKMILPAVSEFEVPLVGNNSSWSNEESNTETGLGRSEIAVEGSTDDTSLLASYEVF